MMDLYGESTEGSEGLGHGGRVELLLATRTHQTRPSEHLKPLLNELLLNWKGNIL